MKEVLSKRSEQFRVNDATRSTGSGGTASMGWGAGAGRAAGGRRPESGQGGPDPPSAEQHADHNQLSLNNLP